jgi:hypothetical protein
MVGLSCLLAMQGNARSPTQFLPAMNIKPHPQVRQALSAPFLQFKQINEETNRVLRISAESF